MILGTRSGLPATRDRKRAGSSKSTNLQKNDEKPGECGDDDEPQQKRKHIAPDWAHAFVRADASDRAGGVIADSEWGREKAHPHREDHDHGVMHLMDTHLFR